MITPKTLMTAINTLLQNTFPDIDVIAQEFEKGFKQPSFTVRFKNLKIEHSNDSIETSLIVKTYYFPDFKKPDASIDVLEKQFEIARMYGNKLYVEDRALNVDEPESEIVDGVLVHEFDLSYEQFDESTNEEENAPLMKDLHFNIESE